MINQNIYSSTTLYVITRTARDTANGDDFEAQAVMDLAVRTLVAAVPLECKPAADIVRCARLVAPFRCSERFYMRR